MVNFIIDPDDKKILDQIQTEGKIGEKYTRYYEEHEDELPPVHFEEAEQFTPLPKLVASRKLGPDITPPATFQMLTIMERAAQNGVPLRQSPLGLGNAALNAAGTPEQIKRWGNLLLAMSITEPGAGSDTKAIQTSARLDGDEWVLNGNKIFVTTGIRCEGVVVWATVDKSMGRGGIKSFLVLKGTPGFEVVRKEKKLGIRISDTAAYSFNDCRIPRDHVLGPDASVPKDAAAGSAAYKGVLKTFNMTRPGVAAGGIGNAKGALRFTTQALADEGFAVDWHKSFYERSAVEQKLIDVEADIEAAELATLRAAWLADKGQPNNLEASVCKAKAGDVCRTGPQRCMELLGAMSVNHDYLVEMYMRDGRISDIYEGTGQIQRLIIARQILGYSSSELQ